MESLDASLLPQEKDHLTAAIRRRNKRIILAVFVLIVAVAIIAGGIVVFLIREHNLKSHRFKLNQGVQAYCQEGFCTFLSSLTPITEGCEFDEENCTLRSSLIPYIPESTPSEIFRLSLEFVVRELSQVLERISSSDSGTDLQLQSTVQSCSSLLRRLVTQLNKTVDLIWSNPNEETRVVMFDKVTAAWNDLNACQEAMMGFMRKAWDERKKPAAAANDVTGEGVYDLKSMMAYGAHFLQNFDTVNANFYSAVEGSRRIDGEILIAVTLYGSGYLVLVFLFYLLIRVWK